MQSEADQLFLRWRDRGDAGALARVFDLAAPALLRLALHLVGDTAAAEDLVQATFVTAMERAAAFDGIRPLDPWLAGILTNHARGLKRDARRIDINVDASTAIESRLDLDEHTPLASALAAEESAALTKAVDALPEPYRAVMLLRLRHGMKDADIAHVLDRSPGAVRVQLHRGREMLRKLLPASLVASAMLIESGRGLAAVKSEVLLAAGSRLGVAAGITGGVLVGKKLAAIVAVCLCLLLGLIAWRSLGATRAEEAPVVADRHEIEAPAQEATPKMDVAKPAAGEREQAAPKPASADFVDLPGHVLDSTTHAGIAGARVELYPPRRTTMFELQERSVGRAHESSSTQFYAFPWPTTLGDLSDEQRAGREPFDAYEPAASGTPPLAVAITDADGAFRFHCDKALGFLVCSSEGYESRTVVAKPYTKEWSSGFEKKMPFESCEISMTPPRRFFGYLVDEKCERIARRMKLRVAGYWDGPKGPRKGTIRAEDAEIWLVDTQPDGSFDCMIGADRVQVDSAEPDMIVTDDGINPDNHQRWHFASQFFPGKQSEPARVIVVPAPCLVVREKSTKNPIERFFLRTVDHGRSYMQVWSGCFFAKGGRLRLLQDRQSTQMASTLQSLKVPRDFVVWCAGHAASVVRVEDMTQVGEILAELEPGDLPRLRGTVHDGPTPVVGGSITLAAQQGASISEGYYALLDVVRTDSAGRFEFAVPNGSYALRIPYGSDVQWITADVPQGPSIDVDFSVPTTIRAHVRDSSGKVCAIHSLSIQNGEISRISKTDEQGRIEWTRLPEGDYKVLVPFVEPEGSWHPDEVIDIKDLRRGEVRDIDVTIPLPDPRFARLVVDDDASTSGWKASGSPYLRITDWVDVAADGRVPVDMQHGVSRLKFLAPDRRTWEVPIPKPAPDGYVVHIQTQGPGYEGLVTSLGSGHPLSRVRITTNVRGEVGDEARSCATDPDGRFHLAPVDKESRKLWFRSLAPYDGPDDPFEGVGFTSEVEPSLPLTKLEIALPQRKGLGWEGVSSGKLSGHVRFSGAQRAVNLIVTAEWGVPGGKMSCSSSMTTARDGEFSLSVPLAAHYHASLSDSGAKLGTFEWDEGAPAAVMQRDFDVK